MSTITLTRADDGRTVELRRGDTVTVRLAENPTTGYQWVLEPAGDAVLALQGSDSVRPSDAAVGGAGERVFTFKAGKAGSATIRLELRRPWEGDAAVAERFAVTLRVRE